MKARAAETLRIPQNVFVSVVLAVSISLAVVLVGPGKMLPEVTPRGAARARRRRGDVRRRRPGDGRRPRERDGVRPPTAPNEVSLYSRPGSPARPFAEAISWLWRLGPVGERPQPGSVGFGGADEAEELSAAVRERRAAGSVVLAPESGPETRALPARRRVFGVAHFARGAAVRDDYTVFDRGEEVVRTRLGLHAIRTEGALVVGADPVRRWGRLSAMWALEPIQQYLAAVLERPLVSLPPLGCLRFDDLPGTIYMQLEGSDKGDRKTSERLDILRRACAAAGAKLNLAVAARGLAGDRHVPTEEVWPEGIAVVKRGIEEGVFEVVCHGLLHYDEAAWRDEKRLDPREFLRLDYETAARHLDAAIEWQRRTLASPHSFVAPAWGYSEGTLRAAAERDLPAWHRAAPEPLLVDGNPRETLIGAGGIGGVHGVQYGSLVRMAAAGLPPTPVLHGLSLDDRASAVSARHPLAFARLLVSRDALRLPRVRGLRWVGTGELIERLEAHNAVAVKGTEAEIPDGAEAVMVTEAGRRLVRV